MGETAPLGANHTAKSLDSTRAVNKSNGINLVERGDHLPSEIIEISDEDRSNSSKANPEKEIGKSKKKNSDGDDTNDRKGKKKRQRKIQDHPEIITGANERSATLAKGIETLAASLKKDDSVGIKLVEHQQIVHPDKKEYMEQKLNLERDKFSKQLEYKKTKAKKEMLKDTMKSLHECYCNAVKENLPKEVADCFKSQLMVAVSQFTSFTNESLSNLLILGVIVTRKLRRLAIQVVETIRIHSFLNRVSLPI